MKSKIRRPVGQVAFAALVGVAAMVHFATTSAVAAPIGIANAGFEDTSGQSVFNEFTFGTPAGWTLYDPNNVSASSGTFPGTLQPDGVEFFNTTAPEGSRVAILFNAGAEGTGAYGFEQTLGATLQANTRYELSVEVGNIASGFATNGDFFNLDEFPGYSVELLAGGNVIAADINSLLIPEGEFLTATLTVDIGGAHANLGEALGIRLLNLNIIPAGFTQATSPDLEVDFDDVRLSATAISEPGTAALGLMGLLVLGLGLAQLRTQRRVRA